MQFTISKFNGQRREFLLSEEPISLGFHSYDGGTFTIERPFGEENGMHKYLLSAHTVNYLPQIEQAENECLSNIVEAVIDEFYAFLGEEEE